MALREPQSFSGSGVRLLIVRTPAFGPGVCLLPEAWAWHAPCPGAHQPDRAVCPKPVRADLEGPLPGVAGEPGGDVPDPVAERGGLSFHEFFLVMKSEEPGPGGDVRREDPAAVNLPCFRRYL